MTDPLVRAKAFVAKINGAGSTKAEVSGAVTQLGKLIAKNPHLLEQPPAPAVERISNAVDKGRGVVEEIRKAAADPAVQGVASSLASLFGHVANMSANKK